jgi:hypothetical protein
MNVRSAKPSDIPHLLALEDKCWVQNLRQSSETITRLVTSFPDNQVWPYHSPLTSRLLYSLSHAVLSLSPLAVLFHLFSQATLLVRYFFFPLSCCALSSLTTHHHITHQSLALLSCCALALTTCCSQVTILCALSSHHSC